MTADLADPAFWAHVRASLSEGICPSPTCRERLQPDRTVPADGSGGRCPRHGVRWMRHTAERPAALTPVSL